MCEKTSLACRQEVDYDSRARKENDNITEIRSIYPIFLLNLNKKKDWGNHASVTAIDIFWNPLNKEDKGAKRIDFI